MLKKILLAYDGSDSSDKAAELALDLAGKYGAELRVLAVARPPEFAEEVDALAILENSRRHYHDVLRPLKAKVEAAGVTAHFEVAVGHPAEQIIYHAERYGVDHIVMGHRGRTFFEGWLLGSVAKQVMSHASCAVTIVR
ncbi:MAG: universal stress protein [Sulfuricellaceae bacterium]|jgi:nucleotide-binding universal stress UspA family protein